MMLSSATNCRVDRLHVSVLVQVIDCTEPSDTFQCYNDFHVKFHAYCHFALSGTIS